MIWNSWACTRKASSLLLQPDPGGLPSVQWALAFAAKVTAGWSSGLKLTEFGTTVSDLICQTIGTWSGL